MVAILTTSSSIRRPFLYNENKVEKGDAVLLSAQNYPMVLADQSAEMRLNFLLKLTRLNTRTKVNAVHISLNFAPGENFDRDRLLEISREYMEGIGFGSQPFLVYQHHDAGHPHLHLVTTNIQLDGSRIPLHNIGKSKSEPTRKAIEKSYGLVPAERQKTGDYLAKAVDVSRVVYGKTETKRAVGNVLRHVLKNYCYCSLPELNAVLQGYNIMADRGGEESRIFKNRGLVYRVLDEKGGKVGVPIKASSFHFKATLNAIESRFDTNNLERKKHLSAIRSAVEMALIRNKPTCLAALDKCLEKQGIVVVKRINPEGRIYGLTYVDHRNRCVFNGSLLGKTCSAKGLLERVSSGGNAANTLKKTPPNSSNWREESAQSDMGNSDNKPIQTILISGFTSTVKDLTTPEEGYSHVPYEWKKRRRRKKRKLNQ